MKSAPSDWTGGLYSYAYSRVLFLKRVGYILIGVSRALYGFQTTPMYNYGHNLSAIFSSHHITPNIASN